MPSSGVAVFDLELTELCEEAFERAGGQLQSGYDLRTARRSLNIMFADWANRGLNMWSFEQGSIPLVAGTATYTLPADTVDVMDVVCRTGTGASQADLNVARISASQHLYIPTKNATGRPIEFFVRRVSPPTITVWPVPDGSEPYTLVYWRLRRIQDAVSGDNTMDVPFRFIPAMVSGLAYYIAQKIENGAPRVAALKAAYEEEWQRASEEDQDKSVLRLVPRGMSV